MGENGASSLLQKEKRESAKSDISKVLFPDTGKITNRFQTGHVSGGNFFPEILVEGTKRGDSMFCGSSVGGIVEAGQFFLNELQK